MHGADKQPHNEQNEQGRRQADAYPKQNDLPSAPSSEKVARFHVYHDRTIKHDLAPLHVHHGNARRHRAAACIVHGTKRERTVAVIGGRHVIGRIHAFAARHFHVGNLVAVVIQRLECLGIDRELVRFGAFER